jgi:penicillin-binding protein 2A
MRENNQQERTQQKPKKSKKRKQNMNVKIVAISFIVIFVLTLVGLAGFMGIILAKNYEIDESKLEMREATVIYDRNDQEVAKLYLENREYMPINEIPVMLQEAFIAVEDQRFYEHQGVDVRAIGRALYRDILARSMVEGGSTITQQLAKNVFLTHEKKLMRKTEEVLIAVNLEQRYPKEKILEMYLNYIYFGHGAYGIESAAQVYFGKEVDKLELGEMAMLAALPKAPNSYSPLQEENKERSEERRKLVLRLMEQQGKITEEEREQAAETPLQLNNKGITENKALFTYMDMVLEEAEEKYGLSGDDILIGGYQIYTSLDSKAQEAMYEAFRENGPKAEELFPASGPEQIAQGSMVIMDHQTGAIAAVMGGRDYVRQGTNRATSKARQPGSTFKPIAVYAPALEMGWHPYDLLKDELTTYPGNYTPRNYDHEYRGKVTMMEAIKKSHNAPAVWLLNEMGIDKGVQSAQSFGFEQVNRELGIALGGSIQVSPLEMANAFGAFANQGLMMEPYLIEKIVNKDGVPISRKQPEHQQVVTAQTAWYMTKMLQGVVQEGTGTRAKISHPVAGKTGTTQAPKDLNGVQDAWFVGYTPQYTAAVWMGFDQTNEAHIMNTSGGRLPAQVFQYVMEKALADKPVLAFERPSGVDELEPPVRVQQIQDLQAFLSVNWDFSLTVDLDFTPNEDDRVSYRIYRIDKETEEKQLLAEITKDQLVDGRRWTDENISIRSSYDYQVTPVNTLNGLEGEPSNLASVEVVPSSLYRKRDDMDQDEFEKWLKDLEEQYNDYLDKNNREEEGKKDKKDNKESENNDQTDQQEQEQQEQQEEEDQQSGTEEGQTESGSNGDESSSPNETEQNGNG